MHSLVRGVLLSWRRSFVGKKRTKAWERLICSYVELYGSKAIRGCLKILNVWIKQSNSPLCINLWSR